jgi:hypothetical protein
MLVSLGRDVGPALALDWWLHALALPGFVIQRGDFVEAFALVAAPDQRTLGGARLAWFLAAARREGPAIPWRFLRRLAASERHRPTARHCFVPLLAVRSCAAHSEHCAALLAAVEALSADHTTSMGVCCEAPAGVADAILEPRGYRPISRYQREGASHVAYFRANHGHQPDAEPIVVPIEDSIDLHYFRPAEIVDVVTAYLDGVWEAGLTEIRIIHGRGRGVQRHRVRRLLARDDRVAHFDDAPADRGGIGATLVRLVPRPGPPRNNAP